MLLSSVCVKGNWDNYFLGQIANNCSSIKKFGLFHYRLCFLLPPYSTLTANNRYWTLEDNNIRPLPSSNSLCFHDTYSYYHGFLHYWLMNYIWNQIINVLCGETRHICLYPLEYWSCNILFNKCNCFSLAIKVNERNITLTNGK